LPVASVVQEARVEPAPTEFELTQAAYQTAIEELELAGTDGPETPSIAAPALAAIREGLADLDDVIVEARDDLAREPHDTLSQEQLLAALDNKVLLLQDTLALLDQTDQGVIP
jgi:signal transduction histidine kinase